MQSIQNHKTTIIANPSNKRLFEFIWYKDIHGLKIPVAIPLISKGIFSQWIDERIKLIV